MERYRILLKNFLRNYSGLLLLLCLNLAWKITFLKERGSSASFSANALLDYQKKKKEKKKPSKYCLSEPVARTKLRLTPISEAAKIRRLKRKATHYTIVGVSRCFKMEIRHKQCKYENHNQLNILSICLMSYI